MPAPGAPDPSLALEDRASEVAAFLETLAEDRGQLAHLPEALRRRLLVAAGRVSRPERDEQRRMAKELRRKDRNQRRAADEAALATTGIRRLRATTVFPTPPALEQDTEDLDEESWKAARGESARPPAPVVQRTRKCYVCKAEFRELHAFYDQMCPPCAAFNWDKRNQTADLRGRVAIVTGSRVKIGYQAAIKLLRAGAHVIVTTRFPRDAARRYAREPDFADWRSRLDVYGLDLRHTPSVEAFCAHVARTHDRLDYILNNACQTVRRPPGFYAHLMQGEAGASTDDAPEVRALCARYDDLRAQRAGHAELARGHAPPALVGLGASAALSQVALLPEDVVRPELGLFPEGKLDQDLQQVDLRPQNSWRLALAEVPTVELLEVQLVNAVAPFVLNARLKPLLLRSANRDKHIVNVSAMEGQFYRNWKTDKHPHTNMAKAALNMMTRTSAADYVKDGIHMNSVDTGWVTDEDPADLAQRKVEEHGFSPPLDIVDGAARIVDPIFAGVNTGEHVWGQFLKDYKAVPW